MNSADIARVKADQAQLLDALGAKDARDLGHVHCPFHPGGREEKTGSLSVFEHEGAWRYRCHSCDAKGTIVDATAKARGISDAEAIRLLTGETTAPPARCANAARPPATEKRAALFPTKDAALAAMARDGWTVTREFEYFDAAGTWVFSQVRIEKAGERKQYRPLRPVDGGFEMRLPEGARPLYRLADLLTRLDEQVLIIEGEKCADLAAAHGFLAVTSAGGSKSAKTSDWSPLKGRDVLISPDNDDPGRAYAAQVRELALGAGARSARIVSLPDLPEAGDVADYVKALEADGKEPGEIGESIRAALRWDLPAPDQREGPRTLKEWFLCDELRHRVSRLSSGYPDLDAALDGGFMFGGLYVVAGCTGGGKSTLVQNVARRAALGGVKTLLVTLEDRPLQVLRKMLAASAHVHLTRIEKMAFTKDECAGLASAKKILVDLPLSMDGDTAALDALALLIDAYAMQGTRLAIVDQMSWVNAPGESAFERASEISRRMKEVARRAGIVLILACQVNRLGSKSQDGPTLHDLRNSGQIAEDSDGVLMLKGVDEYHGGRPHVIRALLEKHRHGPRMMEVRFSFWPAEARVETFVPSDLTGANR